VLSAPLQLPPMWIGMEGESLYGCRYPGGKVDKRTLETRLFASFLMAQLQFA